MTALVPSEIACLESSPLMMSAVRRQWRVLTHGRISRTEVWISRDEMVERWLYDASFDASEAIRSKMSLTNELRIAIALFLRVSENP